MSTSPGLRTRFRALSITTRVLAIVSAFLASNVFVDSTAEAAVNACGKPAALNSSAGVLLWKNCTTNTWTMQAVGGGKSRTYQGKVTANQAVVSFGEKSNARFESSDILKKSKPTQIDFRMLVGGTGKDGFNFKYPNSASVCVDLQTNSGQLLVGPKRAPLATPLNLTTMGPCDTSSACKPLVFNKKNEQGTFLWKDCQSGQWRLRFTGGNKSITRYSGTLTSSAALSAKAFSFEGKDKLKKPKSKQVDFSGQVGKGGQDGLNITLASGSSSCLDTGGRVTVGVNRVKVQSPFDIQTLQACSSINPPSSNPKPPVVSKPPVGSTPPAVAAAYAYLDDADTTNSVQHVGNSNIDDVAFPRITTGPLKKQGPAEMFSKYKMIAVKGFAFNWLAGVQRINPETKGLRIFCPQEYQGFTEKNSCRKGNGMPFDDTGPATANCEVYAGHWLYRPGTRLRGSINASTRTLRVDDATEFKAGRYLVIYSGGPGAFNNAEHARIKSVNRNTDTLTLVGRGYKSSARSHPGGAIVAEHVIGNGDNQEPRNWVYNLSTSSPRDSSGRQLNEVMANWIAKHYDKNQHGQPTDAEIEGVLYDSDFHFIKDSGHGKRPDVNNDLVLDHGVNGAGVNLWGNGLDAFYRMVRDRLPGAILVGGVKESRGFTSLNGIQLEGWPQKSPSNSAVPAYQEINAHLSNYQLQMQHGIDGPRYSEGISKIPTRLYSARAKVQPVSNAPFRFGFGLMLLGNGYYGQQNWNELDLWWDEYAVDVIPGSPTFGDAIRSNPQDESWTRQHYAWMGFPLGPRYRVFDQATFAPSRNLMINGGFDANLNQWSGSNVAISRVTSGGNRIEGSAAMRVGKPKSVTRGEGDSRVQGPNIQLQKGKEYTLAFAVKSSEIRTIKVFVGGQQELIHIPAQWSRQVFTFTAKANGKHRIRFDVGRESSELWFDAIYLFEGNANVFRRDFDNATVVVNATPKRRVVELGETLQRIRGTGQDPINNGASISRVTIEPYDSAILVRR